jgi:tRNA threonylcarbamoyladenosine modification (KEOPS) complex  Pcc1 subunit
MAKSTMSLKCASEGVAGALYRVLAPDNEGTPRGLQISMNLQGDTVDLAVVADSFSAGLSTCVGLLRDVSLFEEVWLLTEDRTSKTTE